MHKFILDQNLSQLAKWLRFLGYDTSVYKNLSFQNLCRIAQQEHRIILTRAKGNFRKDLRWPIRYIETDTRLEQLREIKSMLFYSNERIMTRCSACNRILRDVNKTYIKDLVPEYVFKEHDDFRLCTNCGNVYWKGSHYENIVNTLKGIVL